MHVKYVPPSISELSFNCPHCGALAKQFWHSICARAVDKDAIPYIMSNDTENQMDFSNMEDQQREKLEKFINNMLSGRPFFEKNGGHCEFDLCNVHVSKCYNCDKIAIWIHNRLIWPEYGEVPPPSPDLPEDLRTDYEEAGRILSLSPRGAAALVRLCIQKLCAHLGEKGKNIDADIAELVKKGLDPRVQQALDVVRVVGNNAVHPGHIDLRDDRSTAEKLFGLVNLIVEIMITQPRHVAAMYNSLPQSALDAIQKRDAP